MSCDFNELPHHVGVATVPLCENQRMKRIRVAPGRFVSISHELAEKAARVFGTGLTRDHVRELLATEPRDAGGAMAGSPRPLGRRKLLAVARPKISATTSARKITVSSALRRRTG